MQGKRKILSLPQILFMISGLCLAPLFFVKPALGAVQDQSQAEISKSFHCPETYPSNEAKRAALMEFLQEYASKFPNSNVRDVMVFRYRLLVAHSCIQTLKSMLTNVGPTTEMLSLRGGDYGPKTEEYDSSTQVWTAFFRRNGEPPDLSNEDLIFNFYGWSPGTSSDKIAHRFLARHDNVQILGNMVAPDEVTKVPSYFIISETQFPGEPYVYLNISKISSVGTSAFTVTFSKKVAGSSSAGADQNARAWFVSEEGKSTMQEVGSVGVDAGWEEYLKGPL
jgi:hypothetical protein